MTKEIVFILSHKYNNRVENNIQKIDRQKGNRDICLLYHGNINKNNVPVPVRNFQIDDLNLYSSTISRESLTPGNVHLAPLYFFKEFQGYDHYWFIEYDVEYGGNWNNLFNTFENNDADFITAHITKFQDEPDWGLWDLTHPHKEIPLVERIRSFNPLFKASSRALQFLDKELSTGWTGHYEVTLASLLYHNDFKLLDFDGKGEFVSSKYPKFYVRNSRKFEFIKLGTYRARPARKKVGYRKLLYHPVKEDSGLTLIQEFRFRIKQLKKKLKDELT